MRLLANANTRLFLACWMVFTLFFATNVVREHYPAFTLIERGDWVCDRYAGFHSDIFEHTDGHWYVGNNVLGSLIAVPPLLVFDPVLDALEDYRKRQLAESGAPPDTTYDTKYPLRQEMFRRVKLAGLDLRFGASTAITSALLMAPLSAALAVLMRMVLRRRGVSGEKATWLAFLFAFATPVFYRTAHLNHNMFLMESVFAAYVVLWLRPDPAGAPSVARRALAGLLCGVTFALDYAGAIPAGVLALYLVVPRIRRVGLGKALAEAVPFVLGSLPPVIFLAGTQWAMYGDPFTPGQFVMRDVNYTEKGLRGIGMPTFEVFFKNLFSPSWGLFPFAPLLLLGFLPTWRYRSEELVFPRDERRWSFAIVATFLLFCAANWYSLMQFNTGFRYLLPVVPFLFLAASDHLVRMPEKWLKVVTIATIFHGGVLAMMREVNDTEKDLRDLAEGLGIGQTEVEGYWTTLLTRTAVPHSYTRLFDEGIQLPWLTVLRQTSPGSALLASPLLPVVLLVLLAIAIRTLWRAGVRREFERLHRLPSSAR